MAGLMLSIFVAAMVTLAAAALILLRGRGSQSELS
jgi:hypothetical protein